MNIRPLLQPYTQPSSIPPIAHHSWLGTFACICSASTVAAMAVDKLQGAVPALLVGCHGLYSVGVIEHCLIISWAANYIDLGKPWGRY